MKVGSVYFIGVDGEPVVTSAITREQIEAVTKLTCALVSQDGEALSWEVFYNPEEPRTIFQSIERDRRKRVDEKTLMADRPSFAVVTEHLGSCSWELVRKI